MTTRRDVLKSIPAMGAAFANGGAALAEGPAHAQEARVPLADHFRPKGKTPSIHTVRALEQALETLPRFQIMPGTKPRTAGRRRAAVRRRYRRRHARMTVSPGGSFPRHASA